MHAPRRRPTGALWIVFLFIGFTALMLFIGWNMMQPDPPTPQMLGFARNNPAWTITYDLPILEQFSAIQEWPNMRNGFAVEKSSGAHLSLPRHFGPEDVLERVPCGDAEDDFPPWFRLPADQADAAPLVCARVRGPQEDTVIVNFRTALKIPALWKERYALSARTYGREASAFSQSAEGPRFDSQGKYIDGSAHQARSPPGEEVDRIEERMSVKVDALEGSDDRDGELEAVYYGRSTFVMASFRRPAK